MNRDAGLSQLDQPFDLLVIGGGATGLGAAVDAAARGYRTALIEAEDFAKATSSRSTKLVHGGVRYLAGGQFRLVREALTERTKLFRNAPHLVHDLPFLVPSWRWLDVPYYFAGLKLYDLLAGSSSLPRARILSAKESLAHIPGLKRQGLRAAVLYHDGQFDDARLAMTLARTAVDHGAVVMNYTRAVRFLYERDRLCGVVATDRECGRQYEIRARAVVNAAGIYVDELRALDGTQAKLLSHSRGAHLVVPSGVLGRSTHAIMVPKTIDGRVIFAIPWYEHVVIGTTDVKTTDLALDPPTTTQDVEYILQTINPYLERPLDRADVRAVFSGLRPLVNRQAVSTARLSREHIIDTAQSGLVTIAGGKWTTYRKMAEDVIDVAAEVGGLPRVASSTSELALHGAMPDATPSDPLRVYGSDAAAVLALTQRRPDLLTRLHPRLPYLAAEVVFAARCEMARTVEDVLARRTRALFLDVQAARECAPTVAQLLASELGRGNTWQIDQLRSFADIAARFSL